jgi:hypothetical protein
MLMMMAADNDDERRKKHTLTDVELAKESRTELW